jgi:4-hydroxy-3-methylbut-2-enyl diphosphate reductase
MTMKINIAQSAGFCSGVKRALGIALKSAQSANNVVMLGDIVHNEDVVRSINRSGIKTIKRLGKGRGKTLLIRAHGTSEAILNRAKKCGYAIIDATCPMVKEIHRTVKDAEKDGYQAIIIGDKKHDEVNGIIGQLKHKAIVIDSLANIPYRKIRKVKKACVVVQSTQNIDKALTIVEELKHYIPKVQFSNTVCAPTRTKQKEIKTMPLENDLMIIIGSRTSANTKRLYEISKSLNPDSYWVESEKELKPIWFKKANNVGITAGASTPDETTRKVIRHIQRITRTP